MNFLFLLIPQVKQLELECSLRSLKVTGIKAALKNRLTRYDGTASTSIRSTADHDPAEVINADHNYCGELVEPIEHNKNDQSFSRKKPERSPLRPPYANYTVSSIMHILLTFNEQFLLIYHIAQRITKRALVATFKNKGRRPYVDRPPDSP